MKRFFAAILAAVMLLSMIPAASVAATQYASVVGGWLRLRAGASFEADTITSYYTDTVVEILGYTGNWYHVRTPDGRTGFMYGDYLKLGASTVTPVANAYVTSHNGYGVRLRKGPGTGYRVIHTYAVGTPVTILEQGTYWCKINVNGTIGYMMSQFLNVDSSVNGNGNQSVLCYATIWSGNGYGVRLRTGPGTNYGKIGVYSVGTTVAVLEKGTTWDRIRVGSRTGWMMNDFLIYQNVNEVTSVTLNSLYPIVGTVLRAQAMSPSQATVKFEWFVDETLKGTSSTYTVSAADVNKQIQLKITGTGNYSGYAWSPKTARVISNTQISGLRLSTTAPVAGDKLNATYTPSDATVAYAWKVDGYQVSNAAEYTVTSSDVGKTIELLVTGTGSYSGTLSAATAPVVALSSLTNAAIRNETNTTVGAVPMVGDTLAAVVTPSQATVTYQWYRGSTAISGATSAAYTLTDADLGAQIGVTINGTGAYTGEKSASLSDAVAARPVKPTIDDYAMPAATVGSVYATQLTAQGGGQISWSVSSGNLPTGLSLAENGAITGTPAAEGSFTFAVKAVNAAGSDEKTFAITVAPVAKAQLTVGSIQLPDLTVGYAQPAPVSVSIANVGTANATLSLLRTQGDNADCFIVNENGSSVIEAGETDTSWTVQPKAGLAAGEYKTQFVVTYDGGTASANVTLKVSPVAAPEAPEVPVPSYTVEMVNGTADKSSYQAGAVVSITAATLENELFTGWNATPDVSFADASAATTSFVMPAANVKVTANYQTVVTPPVPEDPQIYSLTVVDGQDLTGSGSYTAGTTVTIKAIEKSGYVFKKWTASVDTQFADAGAANTQLTMPAGNVTVTATYEAATYAVSVNSGSGSGSYAAGAAVAIQAESKEGKRFTGWTASPSVAFADASAASTQFTMPANDVTVTANYETVVYSVTVNNGSGSGSYAANAVVSIQANSREGKRFTGWTASPAVSFADASASSTQFTMPAGNVEVTANYETILPLAEPSGITWSEDGTSVSWNAVSNAEKYVIYRVRANGDKNAEKTISETSYVFKNPAEAGDTIYIKAIDADGVYPDSNFASGTF